MDTDLELMARMARGGVHAPREELMSGKARMLRETDEGWYLISDSYAALASP
jgi:hypothetical protein